MLKKHAQFFKSFFMLSDLFILSIAWILSYVLRFHVTLIKPFVFKAPPLWLYMEFLLPLWVLWGLIANRFNLYRPRRIGQFPKEFFDTFKSLALTLIVLIATIYLFKKFEFSRLTFFYFLILGLLGLVANRFFIRQALKALRSRGYNQRHALIAGTGELGQKILEKIDLHPELGIQVIGYLARDIEQVGKIDKNIPILGVYEDASKILSTRGIDILFIALPISEYNSLENLIKRVRDQHLSDIKVLPGAYEFLGLRGGIDELDELPIVSLQGSPLHGWDSVFKRMFDLILGTLLLIATSPIMLIVSLLIKLTSKGPILYRQERIGMDSRPFQMLKFRTMKMDAEKETGPVWAKEKDPRRTKIGIFLRKSGLDELPQLFNVLKGEMSLVGPRPERPDLIKKFKNRIPLYMLRHKTKAGMTGWAQVNGWRGNTSLETRIEYDLYYIQRWSIGFDVKILLMTLWRGFFSKSAY
jgi:Undecaprenyl-phosphate glucose phosphotransferase